MNGLRKFVFVGAALVAGVSMAQSKVEVRRHASAFAKAPCPTGTREVQRASKALELQTCMKRQADGRESFEGPYRGFDAAGRLQAVGQMVNGFNEGKWTFFDENGVVMGESNFAKGVYHGERVQYFADGRVKSREQWVNGKREGLQRSWDESGKETVVEYRADAPVVSSR